MSSYLRQSIFGLFVVALLCLVFTVFFKGIFFDGLVYGSISRNLAEGHGTLFNLHYSDTYGNRFIDNMPLFYWLESAFFMAFGDHFWVEKVFCLALFLLSIYLLVYLIHVADHRSGQGNTMPYAIVILFLLNPGILWIFSNNMVECLLVPLTLAFILCFFNYTNRNGWSNHLISSLILFAIFLTKGPNGLFVMVVYPLWGFLHGRFFKFSLRGILVLTLTVLWVYFLCILSPEFTSYLSNFYNKQVIESLYGNRESSGSHFTFANVYVNHFLFPMLLAGTFLIRRKVKGIKTVLPVNFKLFIGIGLTLPILFMFSTKQNAYYFSISYSFLYIAMGSLFYDELQHFHNWLKKAWRKLSPIVWDTSLLFLLAALIYLNIHFFGIIVRDKGKMEEATRLANLQHSEIVVLSGDEQNDWSLIGYLQRFHKKSAAIPQSHEP